MLALSHRKPALARGPADHAGSGDRAGRRAGPPDDPAEETPRGQWRHGNRRAAASVGPAWPQPRRARRPLHRDARATARAGALGAGRPAARTLRGRAAVLADRGRALDRPDHARADRPRHAHGAAEPHPGPCHCAPRCGAWPRRQPGVPSAVAQPARPVPRGRDRAPDQPTKAAVGIAGRRDRPAHRRRAALCRGDDPHRARLRPLGGNRPWLALPAAHRRAADPDDPAGHADGPARPAGPAQGDRPACRDHRSQLRPLDPSRTQPGRPRPAERGAARDGRA